jgi:protein-tyrosine phosphatase
VFARNPSFIYELVQMGALTQANSGSFSGIYGREAEEAAFSFLELNLIHFIGSDGHNVRSLAPRLSEAVKRVGMVIGEDRARALVKDNPKAVLEDKEIPYLPEPVNPGEIQKKMKIKIPFLK